MVPFRALLSRRLDPSQHARESYVDYRGPRTTPSAPVALLFVYRQPVLDIDPGEV